MTITFDELKRRRTVITSSAPDTPSAEVSNILTASLGMTAGEFDAVVQQAKENAVIQKAAIQKSLGAKTTYDITTEILKAKYAKGETQ